MGVWIEALEPLRGDTKKGSMVDFKVPRSIRVCTYKGWLSLVGYIVWRERWIIVALKENLYYKAIILAQEQQFT